MSTREEFLEAAKKASLDEIRQMLAGDGSLADTEDEQGISAVLWAAYHGRMEIAEYIAAFGAALNFFEAAALGRTEMVRSALDEDGDLVRACSPDGFSALGLAAFFGRTRSLGCCLNPAPTQTPLRAIRCASLRCTARWQARAIEHGRPQPC